MKHTQRLPIYIYIYINYHRMNVQGLKHAPFSSYIIDFMMRIVVMMSDDGANGCDVHQNENENGENEYI